MKVLYCHGEPTEFLAHQDMREKSMTEIHFYMHKINSVT